MTAKELFSRAFHRYYCPNLTCNMLRKWLLQQVREGLLTQDGDRFYLTSDGREVAARLAGELVQARHLAEVA